MIEAFERQLQQMGYQQVAMQPEQVHVFYKRKITGSRFPGGHDEKISVVLSIDYVRTFTLQSEQLAMIKERIMTIFRHPSGKITGFTQDMEPFEVDCMAVVFSADIGRANGLSRENINTWLVDEVHEELVLYENQPADFHGLRSVIDGISDARYQNTVRNNETGQQSGGIMEQVKWVLKNPKSAWITYALVAINIIVYIVLEIMGDTNDTLFMLDHGAMYPNFVIYNGQWYRLFTSMFLHFGPEHLINNMLMLFLLGQQLEKAVGKPRYLFIYLMSGVCGSVVSMNAMMMQNDLAVSAGASGAIFGVVGGLIAVIIVHKGRYHEFTIKRMLFMAALCLYFGFTSANVDNFCHVGGLITGFVATFLLYGIPYLRHHHGKRNS